MQKAAFSIDNYVFKKITIDLDNFLSNEINVDFDCSGVFITETKKFELTFSVFAFDNKKTKDKPIVYVQCLGKFSFEEVNEFEDIPDFFYRNAIAILFPYLRAYVSMITAQANAPGIILPTYNLSSLGEKLKINTKTK